MKSITLILVALLVCVGVAQAAGVKPRSLSPADKCPVCGMFVAKYPDFAAQIQFRDGSSAVFDGTKDLFKYYLSLPRYAPGKTVADVTAIFVTSYYSLSMIDGRGAVYVLGSDVYGPMGRELIPFAKLDEAREFLADHHGSRILRFREVTPAILKGLD